MGRFIAADPYGGSANSAEPQTWNRYSYAGGDPVNRNDPNGMTFCDADPTAPSCLLMGVGPVAEARKKKKKKKKTYSEMETILNNAADMISKLDPEDLPPPCQNDIDALGAASDGKINLQSLEDAANHAVFVDGTTSTFLYNDVFKNSPNYVPNAMPGYTVADYFSDHKGTDALAVLGPMGPGIGNDLGQAVVFIDAARMSNASNSFDTATVMHELFHSLGMEDPDIATALGADTSHGSIGISQKLASDCFGVKQ